MAKDRFGRWLVGAIGVVAFGISISQLVVGYRAKFREKLALRKMHAWEKTAMITLGRMGFCARALLIALVGLFLLQAVGSPLLMTSTVQVPHKKICRPIMGRPFSC